MNSTVKRSTSPLTTGTLYTYTGGIRIFGIFGVVRTAIQNQVTNCKLSVQNDALTPFDLCINGDIGNDAIGTVLSLPAAVGSAIVETTGGALLNLLAQPHIAICTTSGIITVTFGAASTGVIDWYLLWQPLVPNATVQAA